MKKTSKAGKKCAKFHLHVAVSSQLDSPAIATGRTAWPGNEISRATLVGKSSSIGVGRAAAWNCAGEFVRTGNMS